MQEFEYNALPVRVLFGSGASKRLEEEASRLNVHNAIVLCTAIQLSQARAMSERLGRRSVGVLAEAVMHTPVQITEAAVLEAARRGADGLISVGGGSTTGLGKAMALRMGIPHIVIPTTYAGSEMTPILGQTDNGQKITVRDTRVLPQVVIYDVDLTLALPVELAGVSGMNAIAHAVEALYASDRNPITGLMAIEALSSLAESLPAIMDEPNGVAARSRALYGAWLCGICLGTVGMSLHHKLCHTLGGMLNLPHSETHSVVLPYVMRFNAEFAPSAAEQVSTALRTDDPARGLQMLARRVRSPLSLKALGMAWDSIPEVTSQVLLHQYPNPRPIDTETVRSLLESAWHGDNL